MLPGATVYAADIFCGHGGASLSLLAVELDWMAREQVAVVNISLVGAKSVLLTGLVRAMTRAASCSSPPSATTGRRRRRSIRRPTRASSA